MIQKFKVLGTLESMSFLLLLFVAMPLKYIYGMPQFVRVIGSVHGALFVLYLLMALMIYKKVNWTKLQLFYVFVLASIPLGPYVVNKKLLS